MDIREKLSTLRELLADPDPQAQSILIALAQSAVAEASAPSADAPFPMVDGYDLMSNPPPPAFWVIPHLVVQDGMSLIHSKPGRGKTQFVASGVAAMVTGTEFLGMPTAGGDVVFVTEEGSPTLYRRFFDTALAYAPAEHQRRLHMIYLDSLSDDQRTQWPLFKAGIVHAVQSTNAKLLVIDTIGTVLNADDLTKYKGAAAAMNDLKELRREADCAILCVTHDRKGAGDGTDAVMDSTAITGAQDYIVSIDRTPPSDDSPDRKDRRHIRITKSRYHDDLDAVTLVRLDKEGKRYEAMGETRVERTKEPTIAERAFNVMCGEMEREWKSAELAGCLSVERRQVTTALTAMGKGNPPKILRGGSGEGAWNKVNPAWIALAGPLSPWTEAGNE